MIALTRTRGAHSTASERVALRSPALAAPYAVVPGEGRTALTLAMFCRQANIPFKFMTFTSNWSTEYVAPDVPDNTVVHDPSTCVVEIFNDKMRKSEFAMMGQHLLLSRGLKKQFVLQLFSFNSRTVRYKLKVLATF